MSQGSSPRSLLDRFSALEDPARAGAGSKPEILLLVLCATLASMEDFVEITLWGEQRLTFLRRFMPYERGVPCHEPPGDVIGALDPELFKDCFVGWVQGLARRGSGHHRHRRKDLASYA